MTLVITWRTAVVYALMSLSTYCIGRVLVSYADHPAVVPWLRGSDDYQRWRVRDAEPDEMGAMYVAEEVSR